jgi:hypothetical protein
MAATGAVILVFASGAGALATDQSDQTDVSADSPGQIISDKINEAWTREYDEAKVKAIYDPDVIMMLDTDVLAANRDEIKSLISGALGVGNTYTQIGSLIEYEDELGDLYLASIVEVAGVGHQKGDPLVGFWRIRDGKVIHHIFMYAPQY